MLKFNPYDCLDYPNFISRLRHVLLQKKNASLRGIAKHFGFRSVNSVASLLGGKRPPSERWLALLKGEFKWTPAQVQYVASLANAYFSVTSSELANRTIERLNPTVTSQIPIADEDFRLIAEWYHLPLLAFVGLGKVKCTLENIERAFRHKISISQIQHSLLRLEKLGLIRKKSPRSWKMVNDIITTTEIPSSAIRQHHKGMLQRAAESLEEQDIRDREFFSTTFVFDKNEMAAAKIYIEEFREEFRRRFLNQKGEHIYQLNVQFFSHTL